ncbi:hypothetical protein [Spirosoma sp. 209]|uniref:hypothetical protein n=1 Tax=Spirosoma sp. 209 TaxID=1955701 RepID=UPI00098D4B96|nr:hypothetical protein [Spirosoma sp. 209]
MRTEPIQFLETQRVPDGAGGFTGAQEVMHTTHGTFEPLKGSRDLAGNQVRLKQAYKLTIWANPAYTVKAGTLVSVAGVRATVQQLRYLDAMRRRLEIIAVENG